MKLIIIMYTPRLESIGYLRKEAISERIKQGFIFLAGRD